MKNQELISKMTLEEKASLCSGLDNWHLKGVKRLGIPSIMITDGPHGLRKQTESSAGVHDSVKATCFPTACTTASSWDVDLVKEVGVALGEECLQEEVSVVLGPGVNIKRSPLCGRNFEYFSEDPYLAGHMSAAFINGVQSQGIGTSLKHFACNSQEARRMTISAVIDERTLREIYLTAFEIAVKDSSPYTLMCSYNKINGVYSSENKHLLTEILRDEWGFDGIVMSDWGAVNVRPDGVDAGLDLEMPASGGINDKLIVKAVKDGSLDEAVLDKRVDDLLTLILKAEKNKKQFVYDIDAHDELVRKVARESSVLLKNDGILPLSSDEKILVVGALADKPRFQGAGSSHICPHKVTSILDDLKAKKIPFEYVPGYKGYNMASKKSDEALLNEAVELAKKYDKILIVSGLPDEYESEGFDRTTLSLPDTHNVLIDKITALGKKVVVDLNMGSPVTMPWIDKVNGVLVSYLGGQASGGAAVELLYGYDNPSGKLAETFPLALEDTPCYNYFPGDKFTVQHRESVYVGYRYYETAKKDVLFPFGYGLSYTSFEYSDLKIDKNEFASNEDVTFSVSVTNTGDRKGKEIVEVYVSPIDSKIDRPVKELKAFKKVELLPGETKSVTFTLGKRAFAYYDIDKNDWSVDKGEYDIIVAKNASDASLAARIAITDGNEENRRLKTDSWYNNVNGNEIPEEDFAELYAAPIPPKMSFPKKGEFTPDHCFDDMMPASWLARKVSSLAKFAIGKIMHVQKTDPSLLMMHETFLNSPLRSIPATSQGILSPNGIDGMLLIFNGHFFKGLGSVLKDIMAQGKVKKAEEKALKEAEAALEKEAAEKEKSDKK